MARGRALQIAVAALLTGLTAVAAGQTCNNVTPDDAPDARYQINGNGTVTDLDDGLTWMRCSLGQTWDAQNATCTGTASTYDWQGALQAVQTLDQTSGGYAGNTDWRLPNARELMSIVRYHCQDPAINLTMFPATGSSHYWSSSPLAVANGFAWAINFFTGQAYYQPLSSTFAVRLVRGGAYFP